MKFNTLTHEITVEPLHVEEGEDLAAAHQRIIDNCPECQAARARGEPPVTLTGEQLRAQMRPRRDIIRDRRPRWRDLKNGRR
ncbi:MAG TPA: hypothetical protein VFV99_31975 [Kofleriaceae bacterium]|nr:hypothetical protein [Kofleriaceae bacterium]